MKIYESERFQFEYRSFKEQINQIDNSNLKRELEDMLMKLVTEVKSLDKQHDDLYNLSKLDRDSINDSRKNISDIRKKLTKRIEDFSKFNVQTRKT